jgi:hypothetical protein
MMTQKKHKKRSGSRFCSIEFRVKDLDDIAIPYFAKENKKKTNTLYIDIVVEIRVSECSLSDVCECRVI